MRGGVTAAFCETPGRPRRPLMEHLIMRMNWMTAAALVTTVCTAQAFGQVADDAKAVLTDSAKAIRATTGVTFKVKKSGTGMLKDIIDSDGTVKFWKPEGAQAATWMVEGRVKQPGKADKKLMVMSDGSKAMWLDYDQNMLMERAVTDTSAMQELALCREILLNEWTSPTPFNRELTQLAKLNKTGVDNVGGVVCDIVEAMPATGDRNFTWAIGVADKLPRRVELGTGNAAQKIAMITEIMDLKPATFTAKDFEIAMPAGFTKSPMPAPAQPIQPTPTSAPVAPVELGLKPGTAAPAFSAKTSDGSEVSLESMKGNVVVLEFWGTMFKSSTANAEAMKALAGEMGGKGVKMLGLSCREMNEGAATAWWTKSGLPYPLVNKADKIAADFKVSGYPSYYVIGKDGNVSAFFQDFPGTDKLKDAVTAAMN